MVPKQSPEEFVARDLQTIRALADQFRVATTGLQATPPDPLGVAEIRAHMTTGGRLLLSLLRSGSIDPPGPPPPWLKWTLAPPDQQPTFTRFALVTADRRGAVYTSSLSIRDIIKRVESLRENFDPTESRTQQEHSVPNFLHRHVFLEAVAGWLSLRLGIDVSVEPPVAYLDEIDGEGTVRRVATLFDWEDTGSDRIRLLFLDIGRACEAVCRELPMAITPNNVIASTEACPSSPPGNLAKASLPDRNNQRIDGNARIACENLQEQAKRMSWRWAAMHSMERALANGEDEPGEATIRHEWSVARDAAVDAIQAAVPYVEQAQRQSHRLVALASELRMMSDAGTLADMRRWLAKFEGEAASLRHAFALAHHDAPAHQVGTHTLSHLRAILNVQTQVRYPQATRGLEELREQLVPSDREALDRELAAKKAVEDAELVVGGNNDGMLQVDGPIIEALCAAGLASRVAGAVRYSGSKSKRAQVIATERKKLHAALEAARHALAASPRPEQAIREAASSMLPLLRKLLGQLREVLRMHGNLVARPLDQEEPRYGPTVGSHPPQYWPGASGHDVVTQLAAAVLETLDSGNDPDVVLHDDEWERLRRDVEREAGELQRRAENSSNTTSALNHLSVEGQTGETANVPHEEEDGSPDVRVGA